MKKTIWLQVFDESNDKFKWFFEQYFSPTVWDNLMIARKSENITDMLSIMNDVWFQLPDGRFNIMVNPHGWDDFLTLLELPPLPDEDIHPTLSDEPKVATVADVTLDRRHNGSRMHKFSVPFGISRDKAVELQMDMGYHPAGYGFYSFDATRTLTTWLCGDSCD